MQKPLQLLVMLGIVGGLGSGQAFGQVQGSGPSDTVMHQGGVTALKVAPSQASIDYVHAQAMPMPIGASRSAEEAQEDLIAALTAPMASGTSGVEEGGAGNGKLNFMHLGAPMSVATETDAVEPQEFGSSNHPFSTARADLSIATNTTAQYAKSGKLFFNIGANTFVCSASLIERGVVVTAAHCIANFGKKQFYTNWRFVPGYRNGSAPFGTWTVRTAYVMTSYFKGTDSCAVAGIVCQNDVGVLLLNTDASGGYAGTATGWYGYGWDGFSFTGSGLTHITQIGYPVCLDNGGLMERNDSQGFRSASNSNNTIIGSLMCGGSSGGPWLANFGKRPTLTGTTNGTAPNANIVVGVTSWGYTSTAVKEQGASPFLSTNIVPLVNTACTAVPAACS